MNKSAKEREQEINEHFFSVTAKMETPYDVPALYRFMDTEKHMKHLHSRGMIKLSDIKDGEVYLGSCRNSEIARWSAEDNQFIHWRCKWGSVYEEKINHPENSDGYDVFVPIKKLTKEDYKKPQMKWKADGRPDFGEKK